MVAAIVRGTNGGGFRDLTIPCENFFTTAHNTRNHHHYVVSHAVRRLCVGSGSELQRPRFVAVITYRCRVRFRRPLTIYILLSLLSTSLVSL